MKCIIIAELVRCTLGAPVSTPAQAAALLAPRAYVGATLRQEPRSMSAPLSVAGVRDFPAERPARRLDGTLWTEVPWQHVAPRPLEVRIVR